MLQKSTCGDNYSVGHTLCVRINLGYKVAVGVENCKDKDGIQYSTRTSTQQGAARHAHFSSFSYDLSGGLVNIKLTK